jgi:cytochrome c peroxidase
MTRSAVITLALALALAGCGSKKTSGKKGPSGSGSAGSGSATAPPGELPALAPAQALPAPAAGMPPLPADAPAISPEQVALGELLFFDPRLSDDGRTACAGCHDPDRDWSGGPHAPAAGGKPNLRRALNLSDVAFRTNLGWDGRYKSAENHINLHVRGQLGADPTAAIARIAANPVYQAHFGRAFGGAPDGGHMITALAAFARTRFSPAVPWDAAEHGTAPAAGKASTPEARGYQLFTGKAQCAQCHAPPLYTDEKYYRLGLIKEGDDGRGKMDPDRKGAFKTPPLRGAALRPAYFHDGSVVTLEDAIDWHLAGGTGQGADASIVELPKVTLTEAERGDLIAFVRALSPAQPPAYAKPQLPP